MTALFLFLLCRGRPWTLFDVAGFSNNFYDEQARAFWHLRLAVPADVPGPEGFLIDGSTYLYYGPFLALLRMPLDVFGGWVDGRFARVSMGGGLLRACTAFAVESGSVLLAAAHPTGDRPHPADLRETVGVATHPDCPLEKVYYFAPHRFPRTEWGNLTGKFLTHGYEWAADRRGAFKGSGIATAYLSGRFACLREALPNETAPGLTEVMRQSALTPVPEIGYA